MIEIKNEEGLRKCRQLTDAYLGAPQGSDDASLLEMISDAVREYEQIHPPMTKEGNILERPKGQEAVYVPFSDDERRAVVQTAWYDMRDDSERQHHGWMVRMNETVNDRNEQLKELYKSRLKYLKEVSELKRGVAYVALMKRIDELEAELRQYYELRERMITDKEKLETTHAETCQQMMLQTRDYREQRDLWRASLESIGKHAGVQALVADQEIERLVVLEFDTLRKHNNALQQSLAVANSFSEGLKLKAKDWERTNRKIAEENANLTARLIPSTGRFSSICGDLETPCLGCGQPAAEHAENFACPAPPAENKKVVTLEYAEELERQAASCDIQHRDAQLVAESRHEHHVEVEYRVPEKNSQLPQRATRSQDMSKRKPEFCICKGYDNNWFAGPFDSIEEARAEANSYGDTEPELRIHGVQYSHPTYFLPTLDCIIEQMDEQAYDNGYDHDGDEMHVITKDKQRQAREELEAWAEKFITVSIERWTGEVLEKVIQEGQKSKKPAE